MLHVRARAVERIGRGWGRGEKGVEVETFHETGRWGGESCEQTHGTTADLCMYMYHHIKFIQLYNCTLNKTARPRKSYLDRDRGYDARALTSPCVN
jgi:hypothetical protein